MNMNTIFEQAKLMSVMGPRPQVVYNPDVDANIVFWCGWVMSYKFAVLVAGECFFRSHATPRMKTEAMREALLIESLGGFPQDKGFEYHRTDEQRVWKALVAKIWPVVKDMPQTEHPWDLFQMLLPKT